MTNGEGLSIRELVLEVREDVKSLMKEVNLEKAAHDDEHQELERDLGKRPTRAEMMGLFTLAGVVSGIIFGIVSAV